MNGQKIHLSKPHWGLFKGELKILGFFLTLTAFSNLIFSNNTFALFTPTLSASVDNTAASVNGNQVINSTNKTTEIPLNLTVNTNNKTGYTATLNSETDETALVNNDFATNAKINSISSPSPLGSFLNNTWGYKFGASSDYAPIPALSIPAQIVQTTGKTNGDDANSIKIGMKLSDNLESGRYTNKLIFSILTNNYEHIAIMTEGPDFNAKLKSLETSTNKIEHFKKSPVAPAISMNVVNIDDEESDYEIKLWLDPNDKTAYYYAEPEKVYLNTNSRNMFYSGYGEQTIKNILELDLSSFDTSKVTNMYYMFSGMDRLTSLKLSSFDTSQVTNMSCMFSHMSSLTSLDLSNFNTSQVTNMTNMFSDIPNLTSLDLSSFNTSKVIYMLNMFSSMSGLTNLNLSSFDTSKVTYMSGMFYHVSSLTSLDLSNFDTSSATNMASMFSNMSNLTTLNLSSFNTSNVTDMNNMFADMNSLTSLDLSNFDTSNVSNMSAMFYDIPKLTTLDLSSFNTSQVTDMSYMFSRMSNLISLDLSNFRTFQVRDMSNMFSLIDENKSKDKLEIIYVNNDFDTSELTDYSNIFRNRKKLRGGAGSYLVNPSTTDKTWLRIDDLVNGRPGYFTRKP